MSTKTIPIKKKSPRRLTEDDYKNPKPVYAVWEIAMRCDHACAHCGSRANLHDRMNFQQRNY